MRLPRFGEPCSRLARCAFICPACSQCKTAYKPEDKELTLLGLKRSDIGDREFYYGKGCPNCNNQGYKGRKGCYELMEMSPDILEMAFRKKPTNQIRAKARGEGMVTLQEDGLRKILSGWTTIPEILRITHRSDLG